MSVAGYARSVLFTGRASARPAVAFSAVPPEPARRGAPTRWAFWVALAGGGTLAAAFPPVGLWPLAAVGPALLVISLRGRSLRDSFGCGLVFGLAFFVPLLAWLVNVAWYAWLALAAALAIIFAVLAVAQRLLLTLPGWPLAVAGWWVGAEALRDVWPWGGFPWGRLAMSQTGAPTANWVAVGGPSLLTLLIALVGATLAWLVLERPAAAALAVVAAAGLAVAGAALPVDPMAGSPTARVAAIQGNVPHARDLPKLLNDTIVTADQAQATEQLAARIAAGRTPAPDLVIWPENSTSLDPFQYPAIYHQIAGAVAAVDRPTLVGEVLSDPVRNVGQLWLPGRGPTTMYVKRHLVPFGEYIPYRGLLSKITPLTALQPVDFTPGHRAVVFHVGSIRLGDVICYEIGFGPLVRSEVAAGANLLSVQSNDATFEVDGQTGETSQQLAIARIRAVEFDRAVLYSSTTGRSAIISPSGRLVVQSWLWRRAELAARVALVTHQTPAADVGAWPEGAIVTLTAAALALAVARRVRARRAG